MIDVVVLPCECILCMLVEIKQKLDCILLELN